MLMWQRVTARAERSVAQVRPGCISYFPFVDSMFSEPALSFKKIVFRIYHLARGCTVRNIMGFTLTKLYVAQKYTPLFTRDTTKHIEFAPKQCLLSRTHCQPGIPIPLSISCTGTVTTRYLLPSHASYSPTSSILDPKSIPEHPERARSKTHRGQTVTSR